MPHLVMEYSDPVLEQVNIHLLLEDLHMTVISSKAFNVEEIKSRTHAYQQWFVGYDSDQVDFIHIRLWLLSGQDEAVKRELSVHLLEVAKKHADMIPNITVDIQEMDSHCYVQ